MLRSSEPPWFLGMMWSTSRARWCGVCQATACAAAFAAALGTGEHPDVDRAADRGAVAAAVGEDLLAALLSEGIEALAAQLQQLFSLGVAQFLAAHKAVGALVVAGDAVASEHFAHHPLDALCVVIDLGHVFAQDSAGYVLRGGWAGCCLANPWPRSSMSIRGW